jgi:hypothetical protein
MSDELDAAIAASTGAVREIEERTADRRARYLALAADAPTEEAPATKATKASNAPADASSQGTNPTNEAKSGTDGPATKVRLKATKGAGVPHPSDASQGSL